MATVTTERKIGLIPRLIVRSRMGPKEYAMLITDRRSILVLEKDSKAGLGYALGGAIGSAVANAVATRKSFDYENQDAASFALDPKNLSIPHQALQSIKMKKALLHPVYRMQLQFQTLDSKRKKMKAFLNPPGELVKLRKQQGLGRKQIHHEYAKKVQDVFQQVLSPPTFESVMVSRL